MRNKREWLDYELVLTETDHVATDSFDCMAAWIFYLFLIWVRLIWSLLCSRIRRVQNLGGIASLVLALVLYIGSVHLCRKHYWL